MSTKEDKLKELDINSLEDLSDEDVEILYKHKKKHINKPKKKAIRAIKIIDKTSSKYKVLLKFINKILINIGKDRITDLIHFKDINRKDIILPKNKKILDKMAPELFKYFNKVKSGYYHKSPNVVHNVIRNLIKDIGLKYVYINKKVSNKEDGKIYVETHLLYTIKNI